mmetsp:Transcript_77264/g.213721  ORF Transcript_77264/g.213721 Transcript_77264/m.213721 type:complete len:267 (+) Transcript_77264:46-846(+)
MGHRIKAHRRASALYNSCDTVSELVLVTKASQPGGRVTSAVVCTAPTQCRTLRTGHQAQRRCRLGAGAPDGHTQVGSLSQSHAEVTARAAVHRWGTLRLSRPFTVPSRAGLTWSVRRVCCMARVRLPGRRMKLHRLRGSAGSSGPASSLQPRSPGRKCDPHNISSRRTPEDHTSAFVASKSANIKAMTSGAINCSIPTCSQGASASQASPKSMRTAMSGSGCTATFFWLMLRSAPATCWNIRRASGMAKTSPSITCCHCIKFRSPT